jgi:hypothetical protein
MKEFNEKINYLLWRLFIKIKPINKIKLDRFIKNNSYLVIAIGNYGFLKLILNWAEYLKKLKITNYIVFTADKRVYKELSKSNINTYFLETNIKVSKNSQFYKSLGFNKLVYLKLLIVYRLLKLNINILLSDVDTVWLKDPIRYINTKDYDLQIQSDDPDFKPKEKSSFNTGLYYAKSNKKTIRFFKKVLNLSLIIPNRTDQEYFISILKRDKKLNFNILDPLIFPNGSLYFKKNSEFKKFNTHPSIIHVNWIDGIENKIQIMKEFNFWNLKNG